jgi:hypothetical protein
MVVTLELFPCVAAVLAKRAIVGTNTFALCARRRQTPRPSTHKAMSRLVLTEKTSGLR